MSTNSQVATLSRWRRRGSTAHGYAPESAGWTDRLLSDPAQVRVLPAHMPPQSDWTDAALRTRRLEVRILSGVPDASVVEQKNTGHNHSRNLQFRTSRDDADEQSSPAPTRSPETRVQLPPLAPRDPCSRKHLVRLPGCLPGEAGSIPVGGAKTWPMFVSAGASGRFISGRIGSDPPTPG